MIKRLLSLIQAQTFKGGKTMSKNSCPINDYKNLYIRIPKATDYAKTINLEVTLPADKAAYLKIELISSPKPKTTEIPIDNHCKPSDCHDCHVHYCPVYQGFAEIFEIPESEPKKEPVDNRPTIPGHPNCHYGECYFCQVAECAIKQGWEEIPEP